MQSKLTALVVTTAFAATACEAGSEPRFTQAELNEFFRQSLEMSERCDLPVRTAGARVMQHDLQGAAPLVAEARAACLQSAMELGSIEFPTSAPEEVRGKMGIFRATCSGAYAMKARLMNSLVDERSGQIRVTEAFLHEGQQVQQTQQNCTNAAQAIAVAAGLQLP